MVCDKHNRNPGQRINIDMSNPESVRIAINDRVNENQDPGSTLNDTGGFPDLPRTSPFPPSSYATSFPVPPPQSNISSYNLSSRPYTRPTDALYSTDLLQPGHQMPNAYTTNGSNVISHNTYNSTSTTRFPKSKFAQKTHSTQNDPKSDKLHELHFNSLPVHDQHCGITNN